MGLLCCLFPGSLLALYWVASADRLVSGLTLDVGIMYLFSVFERSKLSIRKRAMGSCCFRMSKLPGQIGYKNSKKL